MPRLLLLLAAGCLMTATGCFHHGMYGYNGYPYGYGGYPGGYQGYTPGMQAAPGNLYIPQSDAPLYAPGDRTYEDDDFDPSPNGGANDPFYGSGGVPDPRDPGSRVDPDFGPGAMYAPQGSGFVTSAGYQTTVMPGQPPLMIPAGAMHGN